MSIKILFCVLGPPDAPSNIVLQPVDPCSMKITWSRPVTLDGVPLFYNITFTNTSTQEIADFAVLEGEEYVFSPGDLGSTYEVQVIAWNAAGSSGELSSEVMFTEGMRACLYADGMIKCNTTYSTMFERHSHVQDLLPLMMSQISVHPLSEPTVRCTTLGPLFTRLL